jgi:hypothetical protein
MYPQSALHDYNKVRHFSWVGEVDSRDRPLSQNNLFVEGLFLISNCNFVIDWVIDCQTLRLDNLLLQMKK